MKHTIFPRSGLFATPKNPEELMAYCMNFSGSDRTVAITIAQMAMNMADEMTRKHEELKAELGLTN